MFVNVEGNEAHFFGMPADFNAVSRAIRKCKQGAIIRLSLENGQGDSTSLSIACTNSEGSVRVKGNEVFIVYPERLRNPFSSCVAMPAQTQPGSMFFISRSQIDFLRTFENDSLDMVLHVSRA